MQSMERTLGKVISCNTSSKVRSTICGFRLNDFNQFGKLRLANVAEYFEGTFFGFMNGSKFMEPARKYMVFSRAEKYRFHSDFGLSSSAVDGDGAVGVGQFGQLSLVDVEHRISAIGKSSYTYRTLLRRVDCDDKTIGKVMIESLVKDVRINPETRKSMPLCEEMLQLKQFCDGIDVEPVNMTVDKSAKKFVQAFVVLPSHIDFNHHVNHAAYILFCEDAASLAAANGIYPSMNGAFAQQNVKDFSVYYENECKLGDTVKVETWQSPSRQLHFRIFTSNEDKLLSFVVITLH